MLSFDDGSDSEDEESIDDTAATVENIAAASTKHVQDCKKCPGCVLLLLSEYNMLTNAYHSLSYAYKYLLTLSVTQVTCERSFSL